MPVAVQIRGGTYIPVESQHSRWDTAGEFRFSVFRAEGRGGVAEAIVRYNVTGDGRMKRLIASESGYLDEGQENEVEPVRLHPAEGVEENYLRKRIVWGEDLSVRGVDARVEHAPNPMTGQKEAILTFIAVPEPGQWGGADRPRTLTNTVDNPVPLLQPVGVIF